jgi:hypothetical protein
VRKHSIICTLCVGCRIKYRLLPLSRLLSSLLNAPSRRTIIIHDHLQLTLHPSLTLVTIVLLRQHDSTRYLRASTLASISPPHATDMCWFTLTPAKGKRQHRHSTDSSCAEDLVRVHHSPKSPRFSDVRVRVPSISLEVEGGGNHHHAHFDAHLNHHHRHPHIHPLHMHPIHGNHHHLGLEIDDMKEVRLRGSGRKRTVSSPCPPPPTREPSRCPPPSRPREPIYRTQVVQPTTNTTTVRESTRAALRSVQQERTRGTLRRVAGYEVLGKQVPWDWDCVSSTVGSSASSGGRWMRRRRPSGLKYPPFGPMDRWL